MQRKNNIEKHNLKKKKIFYLPTSFFVVYLIALLVLVFVVIFFAPFAISALKDLVYNEFRYYSPLVYIFIFLFACVLTGFVLYIMLRQNEKNKKKSIIEENENTIYSSYDADRSYLEKRIAELSEQLLSSQKRWEKVNRLVLSSQEHNLKNDGKISPNDFLLSFGIDVNKVSVQNDLAFLLTSFHESNNNEYYAIKAVCETLNYKMMRGDEEFIEGDMLSYIIGCIAKSRIVIANINGRNPNVFYELGITHMMGKPTILICHETNRIPFDLQNRYVVMYRNEVDLKEKLKIVLKKIINKDKIEGSQTDINN